MQKYCFPLILIIFVIFLPVWLFSTETDTIDEEKERTFYEIVRYGSIEDLRNECRKRGISEEGDELELRRRLLKHEMEITGLPFKERVDKLGENDIVLNHADFIEYEEGENGENLIWLHGSVDINYGGKRIYGEDVKINIEQGIIIGSGDIVFKDDNGQVYAAESFYYSSETDEGLFFSARTNLDAFIYSGDVIRLFHDGEKFLADNISLSTCNLKNPHYRVEAGKLYFYDEGRLLIKDASFYYGSDAIIRLPYFYRRMEERPVQSALYFRERSGLVVQNTYYPFKTKKTELAIKGDFYERLGIYAGADYSLTYPSGETKAGGSAVLSNDVYYYDKVTEKWSPLEPVGWQYKVKRSFGERYRGEVYQRFKFGTNFTSDVELNLLWPSDPYYDYDFERRSKTFDIFKLVGQAERDYPRKGSGFSWYLNDYMQYEAFLFSIENNLRFEPQRNTGVDTISLPEYYQYRLYTITAPSVNISHSSTIFNNITPGIISDISYASNLNYSHTIYYNENEIPSSEVHRALSWVGFNKDYHLAEYIRFSPGIELGATGQYHDETDRIIPDSSEKEDDKRNSLVYGRTNEIINFGGTNLYLELSHDLKYKFFGPDDNYTYGDFRIHELGLRGYAQWKYFTESLTTGYDLRPVYNWTAESYKPLVLDESRFAPLVNYITFTPIEELSLNDRLVIDIASSQFQTNSLSLMYTGNYQFLKDREISIGWNLNWEHYFVNPVIDSFSSLFTLNVQLHKYWMFYYTVLSRNDNLWKYFPETAGGDLINPFVDLAKSFNFFNVEDRKESNFKMKSISFGIIHDLHDWQMIFDYTGSRELSYDGSRYLWNNTYSVSIALKEVKGIDFHTALNDRR
jgi:lipopolysaccharide assembly outer membrane protein LptD (OstA)